MFGIHIAKQKILCYNIARRAKSIAKKESYMANLVKNPKLKQLLIDLVFILVGCAFTAFAVACILTPNGLTTSGLTGLSKIVEQFTGINYSYIYYAMSITVLIFALIVLGKEAVMKILFVSLLYPNILVLFEKSNFVLTQGDTVLAAICFCIFYGGGVGLVLRRGYTFGGSDTISAILQKKIFRNVNVVRVMMAVDGLILVISAFTFSREVALYAFINHFVCNSIMDYVMYSMGYKLYKIEIITPDYKILSDYIMKELGRGVTLYNVTGAYTQEQRVKVSCVCSPAQSAIIRRYLAEHSPNSFVEVSRVLSVYAPDGKRFVSLQEN